jgi:HNH endonuclease
MDKLTPQQRAPRTDCWPWSGKIAQHGYGVIYCDKTMTYAHRLFYESFVGPIPADHEIDHLCRNRSCVRPDHMEAVTSRENTVRGVSPWAVNARKTHCYRGHELSPENTHLYRGWRICRACNRRKNHEKEARRRAKVN